MAETAAELIAGLGEPTRTAACPFPDCEWVSRPYYVPGNARAAALSHLRISHAVNTREKSDDRDVRYKLSKSEKVNKSDRALQHRVW